MHRRLTTHILLFILLFVNSVSMRGQDTGAIGIGIEASLIAGKVYKHEAKFILPIPALTTGIDINLQQKTYGKHTWEQQRNFPTIGLGFCFVNYGIDSVYGKLFVLYPNITIPIINGKKVAWTFRIGDGPAYVTKHYQRTPPVDTVNIAIGGHLNNCVQMSTEVVYHIDKHWDMQAGLNITHFSSSSYTKPNLGINMYGGHIGVSYYPVTSKPERIIREIKPLRNRWLAQVRLSMAMVAANRYGGPSYPVYIATGYASRRWKGKNKLFAGVDYAYYQNTYSYQRMNELNEGTEKQHAYKTAVFAGNEFLFGRLGLVFQAGYYLRQSAEKTDPVYEKLGGHLYLVQKEKGPVKEFFISAMVKTHLNVAELGEFGIGFGF